MRCTDSGKPSLSRDETFVVTVIDENERPTELNMSGGAVAENASPQVVATFSTQDPDNEFYTRQVYASFATGEFIVDGRIYSYSRYFCLDFCI